MSADQVVTCERIGEVAVVTLNRPEVRNAISRELLRRLLAGIAALDEDEDVAAIVLTGADPAFCAGVDLRELLRVPGAGREVGPRSAPMFDCRTPVIGAVNGPAYTGGLELALNCHWLIASERASFADTHARLGLTPGWGLSVLLAEAVGTRRARQLATTGEPLDARRACDWGLVNEVVPHDRLLPRALEMAERIARQDRNAVRTLTGLFNAQARASDGEAWRLERDAWIDPDSPGQPAADPAAGRSRGSMPNSSHSRSSIVSTS